MPDSRTELVKLHLANTKPISRFEFTFFSELIIYTPLLDWRKWEGIELEVRR